MPSMVRFACRAEQTVSRESRITLGADLDALGMPRVELHWRVPEVDRRAMRLSVTALGRELGRLRLGRVWDEFLTDGPPPVPMPGGHHLGTTRMSVRPSDGVVDGNGRAHDVENLYLAGSSLFSTGGDANPTLTIVALAHRLSDHLRGEEMT